MRRNRMGSVLDPVGIAQKRVEWLMWKTVIEVGILYDLYSGVHSLGSELSGPTAAASSHHLARL
jgi:hypothetical protein